jgi:putative ATPase
MTANHSLFETSPAYQPLAARMRPTELVDVLGQEHLLGPGKPLRQSIESSSLHSMILWGPPGVGKTTIARLIAEQCDVHFESISAVLSGVKEIRAAVDAARQHRALGKTLLFVDEVHRFNKAQQDAFLPFVEDGTVIFVGATTENPSFELNNALLSRARVYKLRGITDEALVSLLGKALKSEKGLATRSLIADQDVLLTLARAAPGDGRKALNLLEIAADLADNSVITTAVIEEALGGEFRQFDKGGDIFYEQISALHKAVRGSSADAALYWFARMLDGGCDPLYIARRLVRMASEDIGNADPRAMTLALDAWQVQERLGSPEGDLALAQAVVYLAVAAKSNAVYKAHGAARQAVLEFGSLDVPMHIRNAPTNMMKDMGYGDSYQYAHDHQEAFVPGESYVPEALANQTFYQPVNRGMEIQIGEKLARLREANRQSDFQRYQPETP